MKLPSLKNLIQILKRIIRIEKKKRILKKITHLKGGESARSERRRIRQIEIASEKRTIIDGLLRSWRVGEIKPPQNRINETLTYFDHGFTIKQLREMEEWYWS